MSHQDALLWNETYRGARWTYGLNRAPLAYLLAPDGWIIRSDRGHPDYPWGTADWPRELTSNEVFRYGLVLIRTTEAQPDGN